MDWSSYIPWAGQRVQEVKWDVDPNVSTNLDTVLVNGKKVICAPGLRFSDENAIKMSRRTGWILSFAKLEELDQGNTFLDWISKSAMDKKMQHFANSLLQLQGKRMSEKVSLDEAQRAEFAKKLCEDLVITTGQEPAAFLQNGFFVIKSFEERRVTPLENVMLEKKRFGLSGALPPVIMTSLAMKKLSDQNDLLDLESASEKSSIMFDPSFQALSSTAKEQGSQIHTEYQDICENISNITLDHDLAVGELQTMMENSVYEEAEPGQLEDLQNFVKETGQKTRGIIKDMQSHKNNLNEVRQGLEMALLVKEKELEKLSETVADKNREIANRNLKLQNAENRIEELEQERELQVAKLKVEIEGLEEVAHQLKQENSSRVSSESLYQAEDDNARLSEELKENEQAKKRLEVKVENIKLEAEHQLEDLRFKNKALKDENKALSETVTVSKKQIDSVQLEIAKIKKENEDIRLRRDDLELTVQKLMKNHQRVSSTGEEFNQLRKSLGSVSSEAEVFHSPSKPDTSMVQKMVAPASFDGSYVMTTTAEKKPDSKTVSNLLPKWTAGENVRNYTKRISHAWEFVKENFDQKKFCNLVRISVSNDLGEIIDNYFAKGNYTVEGLCDEIIKKLDKRPQEYLSDFKAIQKLPSESYSAYGHRLKELYKKGTELSGELGPGEIKLLIEQFFDGLPSSEAATLKMVATEEEMKDIDALALRASRCPKPRRVTTVIETESKKDSKDVNQKTSEKGNDMIKRKRTYQRRFKCFYCNIQGHGWRACFKRAREEPNWRPTESDAPTNKTK